MDVLNEDNRSCHSGVNREAVSECVGRLERKENLSARCDHS